MNNSRRAGLVAMLCAVQVLIVGFAIYSVRGPGSGIAFASSGFHQVSYQAKPIAPMAVGYAPVVTIDDVDSHVVVTTSNDRFVHVTDETNEHGFIWGDHTVHDVQTSRTLDGVKIYRPASTLSFGFNDSSQRIAIAVPADSRVVIDRSGGAEVTGLRNDLTVTSQDGRIYLTDIKANNIKAHSDDGRVVATRVSGNVIDFSSNDGRIETSQLEFSGLNPRVTMHTDDGPLVIAGTFIESGTYDLTTNDGHVDLNLALGSSATIDASTGDGRIYVDGHRSEGDGGSFSRTVRVAAGLSSMHVRSGDGSIHISTNGASV
jgi:hypothetical protein